VESLHPRSVLRTIVCEYPAYGGVFYSHPLLTEFQLMRRLIVPSLASLVLLVSACATGPTSEQAPTPASYAAFLTHADQLQPVPGIDGAYRWIDPSASLADYDKILLERIQG